MRRYLVRSLIGLTLGILVSHSASAQLLKGTTNIIQDDVLVGLVWASSSGDPCQYTEFWYLSPDYIYPNSPGVGEVIETTLQPLPDAPEFNRPGQFFRYARSQLPDGKRIIAPVYELERCGPNHDGS